MKLVYCGPTSSDEPLETDELNESSVDIENAAPGISLYFGQSWYVNMTLEEGDRLCEMIRAWHSKQ